MGLVIFTVDRRWRRRVIISPLSVVAVPSRGGAPSLLLWLRRGQSSAVDLPVVLPLLEQRGVLIFGRRCVIVFLEQRNVTPLFSGRWATPDW